MIEVEIKLKIDTIEMVQSQLQRLGFTGAGTVKETDKYFDNAGGEIRNGDSALRIREIVDMETGKSQSQITFKGKKLDQITMTRPEYETGVESAEVLEQILEALGYEAVQPFVVKERQQFARGNMNACLDRVEGLGDFLELEVMAEKESEREHAMASIEQILVELGYALSDTTTTSYLSQLQGKSDEVIDPLTATYFAHLQSIEIANSEMDEWEDEDPEDNDMDPIAKMEAEFLRQMGKF